MLLVVYSCSHLMALDFLQHTPRLLLAIDSMAQQQVAMMTQTDQLAIQNATLIVQNASLVERISALEQIVVARQPHGSWPCPVCGHIYSHRESFKGHIRRLALPVTHRAHCFLDPNNAEHQALLSHDRYGDGDFDSRAKNFAIMLYDTVKSNSSSTMSSENSFTAVSLSSSLQALICSFAVQIQEWLAAGSAAGQRDREPWDD